MKFISVSGLEEVGQGPCWTWGGRCFGPDVWWDEATVTHQEHTYSHIERYFLCSWKLCLLNRRDRGIVIYSEDECMRFRCQKSPPKEKEILKVATSTVLIIYSFTQQISIELLLHARHCGKHWSYSGQQNPGPCFHEAYRGQISTKTTQMRSGNCVRFYDGVGPVSAMRASNRGIWLIRRSGSVP